MADLFVNYSCDSRNLPDLLRSTLRSPPAWISRYSVEASSSCLGTEGGNDG